MSKTQENWISSDNFIVVGGYTEYNGEKYEVYYDNDYKEYIVVDDCRIYRDETPTQTKHINDDIYEKYIVCSKAGIKKHICYDYNEAIDYIYNYSPKCRSYREGIRIDNKGMYIIGIPYISKCLAEYKTIYIYSHNI